MGEELTAGKGLEHVCRVASEEQDVSKLLADQKDCFAGSRQYKNTSHIA